MVSISDTSKFPVMELLEAGHGMQLFPAQQLYSAVHFNAADGALFIVRERLMNALTDTDISEDYPIESIRAPFPDCYFHFETPINMMDSGSKEPFAIEGFYVSEEVTPATPDEPEDRLLTIVLTTDQPGRGFELARDAIKMPCTPGDGRTVGQTFAAIDKVVGDFSDDPNAKAFGELHKEFLRTMVKVLLYTTLHDQRRREVNAKSEALSTARAKQGKERQKAMDRASKLYDYISIGPENADEDDALVSSSGETGKGKKAHIRRGSYVWQTWGPNNSLRRNQWRRPTIVNRGDGDDPLKKAYIVG